MRHIRLALAVILTCVALPSFVQAIPSESGLPLEERTRYVRALKEVSWRHTLWARPSPGALEREAEDALRQSAALARYWGRPVIGALLQAELDRIVAYSKQPEVLAELFGALDNDPGPRRE